jgi:DNA-binding MarR family transcriptional regulator
MGEGLRQRIKQERFESPVQEAILSLLVAADHLQSATQLVCEEQGITRGQFNVLRILKGVYPAGHPRCEIAVRMVERAPDITRLVDRLEKAGLVERARGDEDRRQSVTRITKQGIQLLERLQPRMETLTSELSRQLTRADCETLTELCERIFAEEKR